MSNTSRTRATQVAALAFIAVALLCAGLAAFLVNKMISAKGYTGDRVRPVVVAKHALPAAKPVTREDVHVVMWPEKSIPPGVVADVISVLAEYEKARDVTRDRLHLETVEKILPDIDKVIIGGDVNQRLLPLLSLTPGAPSLLSPRGATASTPVK